MGVELELLGGKDIPNINKKKETKNMSFMLKHKYTQNPENPKRFSYFNEHLYQY